MLNKISTLVLATVCSAGTMFAQSQPCATDDHHHQLLNDYPQLAEFEKQFNQQVAAGLAAKGTAAGPDTTWYDMPIVVHVVHDYGVEFLSDDAIYEAAANWALAFVTGNSDTNLVIEPFKKYIGNARIRLHLATIDPDGNPTKGVVRHYSYLTRQGSDQSKYTPWPNSKYMNIWFTSTLGNSGAAAYAYYPSTAAFRPHYDGVIGLATYLNYSKTIPHEIGHCLNLQHVWGNNNNAAVACGDDEVDDTPPTRGHTPGCVAAAIYDVTCATGYSKTYLSSTGLIDSVVDYPDTTNAQNIMDYTYCANMFSKGQCERMRTSLTSPTAGRNNLITPENLANTGALAPMPDLPPVAEFHINKGVGGGVVTDARSYFMTYTNAASFSFTNRSWNDTISSVTWAFSNGASTPVSTSTTTVSNKFSIPGWVTVSLTATSNAGSNTLVQKNAVYAADTTPVGTIGYAQSFSSEADVLNWPMINYYDNQFKWQFYNGAGKDDNSCVRFRSYDTSNRLTGTATGDYDDFVTPAFNLEGTTGDLYFNFFSTGAYTNVTGFGVTKVYDSLEIDVTTTGGTRWTKIGAFRTTDLANNGSIGSEFIPNASSVWKGRGVAVPTIHRSGQTFFRFRMRSGNVGNNVYIDNVGISNLPSEVADLAAKGQNNLIIYPNPSANGCNLVYRAGNEGRVKYTIRDIAGKVVYEASKTATPNSMNTEFISRDVVGVPGMYIVTLTANGTTSMQKMVVY